MGMSEDVNGDERGSGWGGSERDSDQALEANNPGTESLPMHTGANTWDNWPCEVEMYGYSRSTCRVGVQMTLPFRHRAGRPRWQWGIWSRSSRMRSRSSA